MEREEQERWTPKAEEDWWTADDFRKYRTRGLWCYYWEIADKQWKGPCYFTWWVSDTIHYQVAFMSPFFETEIDADTIVEPIYTPVKKPTAQETCQIVKGPLTRGDLV